MALILSIETATEVCSVAISDQNGILALKENAGANEHSAQLTVFVQKVLHETGLSINSMDAIAVSMGPGSYTGLRIGVSAAKGFCYALDKPLIAISTLKAMAMHAQEIYPGLNEENVLLCPMIDARRMEVYSALYGNNLETVRPVDAIILTEDSFQDFKDFRIALFGNGAEKTRELFKDKDYILYPGPLHATASSIASLAWEKFLASDFEDTAYFEPMYLKDFIAGKPKVKGLH
ncbi:MAG: tRNA (adenosine(37)-N6)-threonylcarbamoyltransferase complex dimerization subunit type 1 TsaB [Bacteroidales bacterium]|nr:tRNA (adenosine(37)-N6)-threonylcarbamoyltransferase complex dimerization subunit type 1 TsaB [Bacteroidales bacterium]